MRSSIMVGLSLAGALLFAGSGAAFLGVVDQASASVTNTATAATRFAAQATADTSGQVAGVLDTAGILANGRAVPLAQALGEDARSDAERAAGVAGNVTSAASAAGVAAASLASDAAFRGAAAAVPFIGKLAQDIQQDMGMRVTCTQAMPEFLPATQRDLIAFCDATLAGVAL